MAQGTGFGRVRSATAPSGEGNAFEEASEGATAPRVEGSDCEEAFEDGEEHSALGIRRPRPGRVRKEEGVYVEAMRASRVQAFCRRGVIPPLLLLLPQFASPRAYELLLASAAHRV